MMVIDNKYKFRQIVYLITDVEQKPRMVIEFLVREGNILYKLVSGTEETYHYDYEISETVTVY